MPVALVGDSMMALLDQNTDEKVEEKGASDKHYANNAQLLDDWFKNVCPRLRGYPITLLGINHMKPGQEKVGLFTKKIRNIGGGKSFATPSMPSAASAVVICSSQVRTSVSRKRRPWPWLARLTTAGSNTLG